jgi:transcriptional regulator with XRE-family HTH domain
MIAAKVKKSELRKLMAARGLTGYQVAKILGVSPQTAYCYMCGVRPLRQQQLEQVKNAPVP